MDQNPPETEEIQAEQAANATPDKAPEKGNGFMKLLGKMTNGVLGTKPEETPQNESADTYSTGQDVSRRDFLKGAAAVTGAAALSVGAGVAINKVDDQVIADDERVASEKAAAQGSSFPTATPAPAEPRGIVPTAVPSHLITDEPVALTPTPVETPIDLVVPQQGADIKQYMAGTYKPGLADPGSVVSQPAETTASAESAPKSAPTNLDKILP